MSSSSFNASKSFPNQNAGQARVYKDPTKSPRQRHHTERPKKETYGLLHLALAIREADLGSSAKTVLYTMATYSDFEFFDCDPSVATIAKKAGLGRSSVHVVLRELERFKVLRVTRNKRNGINEPNWYVIDVKKLESLKADPGKPRVPKRRERVQRDEPEPATQPSKPDLASGQPGAVVRTRAIQTLDTPYSVPQTTPGPRRGYEHSNGQCNSQNKHRAVSVTGQDRDSTGALTETTTKATTREKPLPPLPAGFPDGENDVITAEGLIQLGFSPSVAERLGGRVTVKDLRTAQANAEELELPEEKQGHVVIQLLQKFPYPRDHDVRP